MAADTIGKTCCSMLLIVLAGGMVMFSQESSRAADDIGRERSDNTQWAERAFRAPEGEAGADSLPFSFVYGGRSSRDVVAGWRHELRDERLDDARRRTLVLTDPATGLEVRAVCTIYTDTPGVDWTIHFTNTGDSDTAVLEALETLDATVALEGAGDPPVLHRLRGSTAGVTDWLPFDDALPAGERIAFAPVSGRSSKGASPFFQVSWPGGGVITAIGWTGRWGASVEHVGGALRLRAGLQRMHLKLHPGETIRGPRILQLYWLGEDPYRGYNLFRQTMLRHIMPTVGGTAVTPPIAHLSTSFYDLDKGTEADVLSHLRAAEGLGFEYFWLDAYRGRDAFPTVGHYVLPVQREVDAARFPRGLRPISDAAHAAGMKFLLWFEPERICPGTLMAVEHPEWVLIPPPERMGHGGMINLALPEARAYVTQYLNAAVEEYAIDCLRIDNAVDYAVMWDILDQEDPERVGMAEIRYVEGLYRMWDDLLAAHPGLFIDNCASGGQRIDLETCARSIPLWRTDATIAPLLDHNFDQAAICNQAITAGLSRYLPFHTSGQMGASPYLFRSGFNAGIAFCEDIRAEDYPRALLEQAIAEGKRLRKYYFGDFYPLLEVTTNPEDWCVMQYHRPQEGDGMVVAFRRHASAEAAFECHLRAVDPEAEYHVSVSEGYSPGTPVAMKGAALRRFAAEITEGPGSLVMEYKRIGP